MRAPWWSTGFAALMLAGCHAAGTHTLDDFSVAANEPSEEAHFRLYVWMQPMGREVDTYTPIDGGGLEAKASFMLSDRSADVPMAASFRLDGRGLPVRVDGWGFLSRDQPFDEHLQARGDGRFAVRMLSEPPREIQAQAPYVASFGYAPMLGQELLLRAWLAHGRPQTLALVPEGNARLQSTGFEEYSVDGKPRRFEHVVIDGLTWGREDVWLDDGNKLAAVVTRDNDGGHFEGVRSGYYGIIEALMARAGADEIRWLASAAHGQDDGERAVALVGGRLIDGSDAPAIEDATLVYRGDRIVAAGPRATTAIPAGARIVDVHGKSMLPGLWDMHAHVHQVEQAAAYLASGITTVRDEGNVLDFITALRDAIDSGRGIGPRIIVDGLVDGPGIYSLGALKLEHESDIVPLVDKLVRAHCAEVKVYGVTPPELVGPLVVEAHRRGLRVTGHIPMGLDAERVVDLGFDGVNHVDMIESMIYPWNLAQLGRLSPDERQRRMEALDIKGPMVQRLLHKMAERHVLFDPTLAIYELANLPASELPAREPGLAKAPPQLRRTFPGIDKDDAAMGALTLAKYTALVAEAHRLGVPIVAGSDESVVGYTLHRELELYVAAGMTPLQALQTATSVPAKALGRGDELGTLSVGKRADILVVDGNPLADIHDTRKVSLVVARGRSYQPAPLWTLAGFAP